MTQTTCREIEADEPDRRPGGVRGPGADFTVMLAFDSQGFATSPLFRKGWGALLSSGMRSSRGFRAEFCKARHVRARVNGTERRYAIVRGHPVEYGDAASGKIVLKAIGSPGIVARLLRSGPRIPPPSMCPQPVPRYRSPRAYGVTVRFSPPGSAAVGANEQRRLFTWYAALPPAVRAKIKRGQLIVVVEGFTSTTQPSPANKRLSQRRASNVQSALMGVIGPGARYTTYAWGESRAKTRDDVEDPKERRVRVSVIDR